MLKALRQIDKGDGGQAGGDIWVYIEFIVARLPTLQILGEIKGDGGQAGGDIWVYIEFIVARLPTLQILGEIKVQCPD